MNKTWTVEVVSGETDDDLILPLPSDMLATLGWLDNDELMFEIAPDGKSATIVNLTNGARKAGFV